MAEEIGGITLRKEVVDSVIKGFAERSYKFKQAVSISTTNAWKESFFRETATALSGQTGNAVKGIPRGASFPQATPEWTKVASYVEKYGLEDFIHYEDIISDDVDVQTRVLYKLSEGVVKAVDDEIWDKLTESQSPSEIQEVAITAGATTGAWDTASASIIDNLMNAKQLIGEYNYSTNNLMAFISEKDHRSIVNYLAGKGSQFPKIGEDMAENGRVGKLAGIQLVVSNSVTASYAMVCVPKICATWKQAVALASDVKVEAFKGTRIRVCEMGTTQLTDPKAVVLISNTQE